MRGIRPVVRYLIVCEDIVLAPANTGKGITLVGLISTIRALIPYPVRHAELCVFVQLTECRGTGRMRIEILEADSDRVVFRTHTRSVSFVNDPLEVVAMSFRIRHCEFPAPGLYWVQFWYNEASIAQQPVILR